VDQCEGDVMGGGTSVRGDVSVREDVLGSQDSVSRDVRG